MCCHQNALPFRVNICLLLPFACLLKRGLKLIKLFCLLLLVVAIRSAFGLWSKLQTDILSGNSRSCSVSLSVATSFALCLLAVRTPRIRKCEALVLFDA